MPGIPSWRVAGDWFDLCSCSIPCPCEFAQPPTGNHCQGVLAFRIREGNYGTVRLDGLNSVFIGEFEGNIWAGAAMTLGMFFDDRADDAQEQALQMIFGGKAGGWPGLLAALFGEVRGVERLPITIEVSEDLSRWSVEIPGRISGLAEALSGPTAAKGVRVQLLNPPGSEVGPLRPGQAATWAVATTNHVDAPAMGFRWELDNRSSKHIPFDWRGPDER